MSAETKFTPGPWRTFDPTNPEGWHGIEAESGSIVIFGNPSRDYGGVRAPHGETRKVEATANAHLIAAAPELFNFVDIVASMDGDGGLDPANMLRALIQDARGLRAKARGEAA
jgi:hypothetical protein